MTLGPKKERVMTAKTGEQDEPLDYDRFRTELAHDIERFIANSLQLWAACENTVCRRARHCAGRDFECVAKWSESLPPRSPEQERAHLIEFQKALAVRIRLGENVTAEQLAEAIDRENAAMPPQDSGMPAPVVEGTQLAPEQQQRIDRALNGTVKEQDRTREPGPRITQL
jgi:hypothetical protein